MHSSFATSFCPGLRVLIALTCFTGLGFQLRAESPQAEDNPFALAAQRQKLQAKDPQADYLLLLEAAAFRRTDEAAAAFARYEASKPSDLKKKHNAMATLAAAYMRDGHYAEAAKLFSQALEECRSALDADAIQSANQCVGVAQALRASPAQVTSKLTPSELPFTRDKVNLANIAIRVNGEADTAIWDTGANFSMANESFAKSRHLRRLPGEVEINTSTGQPARGHIALADELEIGGCHFHNVAFIVLPDSALSFPQVSYAIHAVIGFPVIDALGCVRFEGKDRVRIGLPEIKADKPLLALVGNTPLLAIDFQGKRIPFLLDSGARSSSLREPFVHEFPEIAKNAKTESLERGGAGGTIQIKELVLPSITLGLGADSIKLEQVNVETEANSAVSQSFGTIGSDVLFGGGGYEIDLKNLQFRLLHQSAGK